MVLLARLAFIALIPLGIYLLIKAIKLIGASFFGAFIAEAKLAQKLVGLAIPEEGLYVIWLRGSKSQVLSIEGFQPTVWENSTRLLVPLDATIGRMQASDSDGFRMKVFSFSASAGSYTLDTGELPKVPAVSGAVMRFFTGQPIDPGTFVVQVRKTKPAIYGIFGILLCIVSGFLIIGGIVFATLADQIINVRH
ncbi:MAG: hypothetical protein ACRYFZ_17835 [Janthinobacterium lividum]